MRLGITSSSAPWSSLTEPERCAHSSVTTQAAVLSLETSWYTIL